MATNGYRKGFVMSKVILWIFRSLVVFCLIYVTYLASTGFDAGMLPVWIVIMLGAILMSIPFINKKLLDIIWLRRTITVALIFVVMVEAIILYDGFKNGLDKSYDYVIVLGAGLHGDQLSLTLKKRLDVALSYLAQHEETIVVVSGGQGVDEWISEARAMKDYLVSKGIDNQRVIMEDTSTSTRENIHNAYLIVPKMSESKVAVITSRFHVHRAIRIGYESGYKLDGIGARTLLYLVPNYYFREFFAVVSEYLT